MMKDNQYKYGKYELYAHDHSDLISQWDVRLDSFFDRIQRNHSYSMGDNPRIHAKAS